MKSFLDSEYGQSAIRSIQTGTTIISITPNNLKEMQIPLLSIDRQEKISNIFKGKLEEIVVLLNKYEEIKKEMVYVYDKNA